MASLLVTSAAALLLAASPPSTRPRLPHKTAKGMVIGGTLSSAVTLWAAGMVSASLLDSSNPGRRQAGRLVPLPVAGPVLAAAGGDEELRPVAPLGVYQAASLAVLAVGSTSLARHHRAGHEPRRPDKPTGVILLSQGVMWLSISWGVTYGFSRQSAKAGDPFAQRLQVPLVGGFLAATRAPTYTRGYLGLSSSAFQLLSAGVIAYGVATVASHRQRRNLALVPMPSRDGGQVVVTMRF